MIPKLVDREHQIVVELLICPDHQSLLRPMSSSVCYAIHQRIENEESILVSHLIGMPTCRSQADSIFGPKIERVSASVSWYIKMAVNLTFYNTKHSQEMDTCTKLATSLLEQYEQEKSCDECAVTIRHEVNHCNINTLKKYNERVCAILYSSGYWCFVLSNKKISTGRAIGFGIGKMTAIEQASAHNLAIAHVLSMD